jgi:hypothetical protein
MDMEQASRMSCNTEPWKPHCPARFQTTTTAYLQSHARKLEGGRSRQTRAFDVPPCKSDINMGK